MKYIYNKIEKSSMTTMPQALFKGRIVVIQTAEEANKAVAYLNQFPVLGIDTETRPSFKRGLSYKVSLIQISTLEICFLFRIHFFDITPSLLDLLQNKEILKIGLSLKDDLAAIRKRVPFTPQGFIDLQQHVRPFGIEDMSLQKLYANLFGEKISKSQQLTNWELAELNEKQKQYAATDAWACLMMFDELNRMKQTGNYTLIQQPPKEKIIETATVTN